MKDQPKNIYVSRRGITLTDGFYLATNPRTGRIVIISIANGEVYLHDVTRKMNLNDLIYFDSTGYLDISGMLKLIEPKKDKTKK